MSATMLLSLAHAMNLIKKVDGEDDIPLYTPGFEKGTLKSFHYTKKYQPVDSLRAKVLSAMQMTKGGREALKRSVTN